MGRCLWPLGCDGEEQRVAQRDERLQPRDRVGWQPVEQRDHLELGPKLGIAFRNERRQPAAAFAVSPGKGVGREREPSGKLLPEQTLGLPPARDVKDDVDDDRENREQHDVEQTTCRDLADGRVLLGVEAQGQYQSERPGQRRELARLGEEEQHEGRSRDEEDAQAGMV